MKSVPRLLLCAILWCAASQAESVPGAALKLNFRTRVEAFKGSGDWQEVHFEKTLPVARTAIVICDMWDKHWCSGASRRVDGLVATHGSGARSRAQPRHPDHPRAFGNDGVL